MIRLGKIICAGGANFDIHSRIQHPVVPKDSNISHVHSSAGGVGRNIAENLAHLGENCVLLTALGDDAFGNRIALDCEKLGIDTSHAYIDREHPTSTYIDILDNTGDMCLATNDMRILNYLPDDYFTSKAELIQQAAAVVVDANLSSKQIEQITDIAFDCRVPVYADPVSTVKAENLLAALPKMRFIKPNAMELAKLSGMPADTDEEIEAAAASLLDKGLKQIAVSLGSKGAYYAERNGVSFFVKLNQAAEMVNASGAGDAFTAAYVYKDINGAQPNEKIEFAMYCAYLTTQCMDTINPEISKLISEAF